MHRPRGKPPREKPSADDARSSRGNDDRTVELCGVIQAAGSVTSQPIRLHAADAHLRPHLGT